MAWIVFCWSLTIIVFSLLLTAAESAGDLSRCPASLPRTQYLKASGWGKCYMFHLEERSWRSASYICSMKGGHLVTIKEERIQNFLIETLSQLHWPRNGVWIGATDRQKEMEWFWVTGERVTDGFSRWARGQPSCGFFCFEDCALMRWKEGGRWHDYSCNWLEDYSFICEYNMLPEPETTTLQSTTSTTTAVFTLPESTTFKDVETTSTTPTPLVSSSDGLESYYLFHINEMNEKSNNIPKQEGKNDTLVMLPPSVMLDGTNGARAEQVQENVSSSHLGLGSGTIAFIVIAILMILVAGLCFMLVVMRRRHKNLICEDNKGISYENPYYESPVAEKGNGDSSLGDDDDTIGGTDDEDTIACSGCEGVGFTACVASNKQTQIKPPAPHHPRPRLVMNDYDTPPTSRNNTIKSLKKGHNPEDKKPNTMEDNEGHTFLMSKETSVYYDELQPSYANGQLNYDIPRASSEPWYNNNDQDSNVSSPSAKQMYYNNYNENIYESIDNLMALGERQAHAQASVGDVDSSREDDDDTRYVPFLLDTPKVVSSE